MSKEPSAPGLENNKEDSAYLPTVKTPDSAAKFENYNHKETRIAKLTEYRSGPLPYSVIVHGQVYEQVRILGKGGEGEAALYRRARKNGAGDRLLVLKKVSNPFTRLARMRDELEPWKRWTAITRRRVGEVLGEDMLAEEDLLLEHGIMVLPFVQGSNVRDVLDKTGSLPAKQAMHLAYKIAKKLRMLHGAGVTHRDVKPSNILLMPNGEIEVVDFGIARTGTGIQDELITGTPTFMSPEQAFESNFNNESGKIAGPRSDVYSLGHVLYEAASGRSLINAPSALQAIDEHLRRVPDKKAPKIQDAPIDQADTVRVKFKQGVAEPVNAVVDPFAEPISRLGNGALSSLLHKMLAADDTERIPMPLVEYYLRIACKAEGIDPDAPLFIPVNIAPENEFTAEDAAHSLGRFPMEDFPRQPADQTMARGAETFSANRLMRKLSEDRSVTPAAMTDAEKTPQESLEGVRPGGGVLVARLDKTVQAVRRLLSKDSKKVA